VAHSILARSRTFHQRSNTFAQTTLSTHFSLATRRRTIHWRRCDGGRGRRSARSRFVWMTVQHRPDRPVAQRVAIDLPAFGNRTQQPAVLDPRRDHPGVDAVLDPDGDGDGTDAPALALKVGQDPPSSRCWMVSTSSSASSLRRRAQPTSSARITKSRLPLRGTLQETEIYVRLQRVDVMLSIV
jgi:hypothetical protein